MNYLAHAFLSFNNPDVLAGNMISDFVKGKTQYDYPLPVQKGIKLHRAIDTFTDNHKATRAMQQFFKPHYRLYAGAFCDVVYDHFLAIDTTQFAHAKALEDFTATVYKALQQQQHILPPTFKNMLPHMIANNWLYNYQFAWGIEKSFAGVVRRSAYLTESAVAFELFNTHYAAMQSLYQQFFPDVKSFAANQLQQLLNN
jgi:acyl carrier protein phosphodiesterase